MAKAIRRARSSKVTGLVMYTVIYIASLTCSYILLSQFTTQVATNTITRSSWAILYVLGFFAITGIFSGFLSLVEFYKFFGGERSKVSSMVLLTFRVMLWITVAVELIAIAAVATTLKLGVIGNG